MVQCPADQVPVVCAPQALAHVDRDLQPESELRLDVAVERTVFVIGVEPRLVDGIQAFLPFYERFGSLLRDAKALRQARRCLPVLPGQDYRLELVAQLAVRRLRRRVIAIAEGGGFDG